MNSLVQYLWLIPALPLLAAGLSALMKRPSRTASASLAIGSMVLAFFLSCAGFVKTLADPAVRFTHNFDWFVLGETTFKLGWVLDPLTAAMLVMITFVGTLIFIFSVGYMAHDDNFTRFFTFLSLFAAAMLGLVIANNLLLLFMCWEVVGLASYLLIGFWFHKPSAAAAAKKAFITTRIGDVFFFLGILWLSAETGTLLFYDGGAGCMEQTALAKLVAQSTWIGMGLSTAIGLLLFCGAMGKSGQVPLHVWLPDAMEGPTPVSALIHAATMVAAGVFLIARVYPLMSVTPESIAHASPPAQVAAAVPSAEKEKQAAAQPKFTEIPLNAPAKAETAKAAVEHSEHQSPPASTALQVVTWIGAITALMVPATKSPVNPARQVAQASPPVTSAANPNFAPASFNRGLSEVHDEGVVWKSNNQPHTVVRVVYKDLITIKDANGRTFQVEQPRVEYMLVPAKTD